MQLRRFLPGLVVPVVAVLALSSAEAQVKSSSRGSATGSLEVPWSGPRPITFDGYYTHYRLDTESDDRFGMNGVGARLMWRPMVDSMAPASRFGLGVFGEYAPADDLGFSLWHVGLQGDVAFLTRPWWNRLTPIASLGAGLLRSTVTDGSAAFSPAPLGIQASAIAQSKTTLALTPAAGLKLEVWRHLGLRADARDLITLRDGTRHNWQFSAGLSFPF